MKIRRSAFYFLIILLLIIGVGCSFMGGSKPVTLDIDVSDFNESAFIEELCLHTRNGDSQFILNFYPSQTLAADVESAIRKAQSSRFDCAYNVDSVVWNTIDHDSYIYSNFKIIYSSQGLPHPQIKHFDELNWSETLNAMLTQRQTSYTVCIPAGECTADELIASLQSVVNSVDQALFVYSIKEDQLSLQSYEDYLVPTLTLQYRETALIPSSIYHIENAYEAANYMIKQLSEGQELITVYTADMSRDQLQLLLWAAQINDSADMVEEALNGSSNYYENKDGSYIAELSIQYSGTQQEREEHRLELKQALHEIEQQIRTDLPELQDELYLRIAQAVAERASYDNEMSDASIEETLTPQMRFLRTAYGALCDGRSVCTSYAAAFKALCDRFSLPCWVMMGDYDGTGHAWNCVLLDGELRYVDVTFFDTAHDTRCLLFTPEQYQSRPYTLEENYVLPDWYTELAAS